MTAPPVARARPSGMRSVAPALGDRFDGEIAASAGPVLDDELLPHSLRQPLTYQARKPVSYATGGEPHDDPPRPRWIGLRPSNPRHGRERGGAGGQMQKISAGKFHL